MLLVGNTVKKWSFLCKTLLSKVRWCNKWAEPNRWKSSGQVSDIAMYPHGEGRNCSSFSCDALLPIQKLELMRVSLGFVEHSFVDSDNCRKSQILSVSPRIKGFWICARQEILFCFDVPWRIFCCWQRSANVSRETASFSFPLLLWRSPIF